MSEARDRMRGREGESAEENGVDDARKDEALDAEATFVEEVREIRLLPLRGVKKRRDSSPTKRCVGDHAEIGTRPKVLRMLAKHDESRILFTDSAYGPTARYLERRLQNMGISATRFPPRCGANIAEYIQPNTRVIYLESPGSLTFEISDTPAIVKIAKNL